jgi:hypothetical protein
MAMDSRSRLTKLIAVRFTEQELERLEREAADRGIGTSTLVRIVVNRVLKPAVAKTRRLTSDEFDEVMASTLRQLGEDKVRSFVKDVAIGNPDDPTLLVWAGQTEKWEEYTSRFLKALLASLGIEVGLQSDKELIDVDESPAGRFQEQPQAKTGT